MATTEQVPLVPVRFLHETVCPPFRTSDRGKYIVKGLFLETLATNLDVEAPIRDDLGPRPIYTLKPYDHEIKSGTVCFRDGGLNLLRSLYEVYLEYGDPSEYSFAMGTFGSWEHWVTIREAVFFQKFYKRMRDALRVKIESEALLAARKVLKSGIGPTTLQAAKWLRDAVKPSHGRGRPSKDQVEGEIKRQAEEAKEFNEDLERLGL